MTTMNPDASQEETVNSQFLKGLELHDRVLEGDESEDNVRKCIMMLEDVTRMVSALELFSRNEDISEVSTQSVKFFLLPVLLGNLNAKLTNDMDQRLEVRTYYK